MACASSTQLSGTSCREAESFEVKTDGSDRAYKSRTRRNGQTCTDLEQYETDLQPRQRFSCTSRNPHHAQASSVATPPTFLLVPRLLLGVRVGLLPLPRVPVLADLWASSSASCACNSLFFRSARLISSSLSSASSASSSARSRALAALRSRLSLRESLARGALVFSRAVAALAECGESGCGSFLLRPGLGRAGGLAFAAVVRPYVQ